MWSGLGHRAWGLGRLTPALEFKALIHSKFSCGRRLKAWLPEIKLLLGDDKHAER
jgi:hypothetical protein